MGTIIFYAIPKTGGTNLNQLILSSNYKGLKQKKQHRGGAVRWKNAWYSKGLSQSVWNGNKCLYSAGHEEYKAVFEFTDVEMVFMLRHPVERIISHYAMILHRQNHNLWTWEATQGINCNAISLEEIYNNPQLYLHDGKFEKEYIKNSKYLCGHSCFYHDFYLRMLSPHPGIMPMNDDTYKMELCQSIVESIRNNKLTFNNDKFPFTVNVTCCITEEFNNSINQLNHKFHWNIPFIEFIWTRKYPLSTSLYDQILKHNKYDLIIYNAISDQFHNNISNIPINNHNKIIQ